MRRRFVLTSIAAAALALMAACAPTKAPAPAPQPQLHTATFDCTGDGQNFLVPAGVTAVGIDAHGAQGGAGDVAGAGTPGAGGGGGSDVRRGATTLVAAGGGGGSAPGAQPLGFG